MKQKYNSSIQEGPKTHQQNKLFKQTIRKVEFNTFKEQSQKKRLVSLRNRMREEWLQRIKIIPPRFGSSDKQSFFRSSDQFYQRDNIFKMFRHNHVKKDEFVEDYEQPFHKRSCQSSGPSLQIYKQNDKQRKSYNNTNTRLTKCRIDALRVRKLKQNWKLAYRRDQINILRFSTVSPKQQKHALQMENVNSKQMINQPSKRSRIPRRKITQCEKQQRPIRLNGKRGKTSLILRRPLVL